MKDQLYALNKTPGVLGSAWIDGGTVVSDMGDAIGGPEAVAVAQRAAEACRVWMKNGTPLEAASFRAEGGRLIVRTVGDAMLIVFTEEETASGMVKVRMREIAEQIEALSPGQR
jgi:predicted regulator of Ras-like GTPase activity (Roadblock/LC7/MglB family)